MSANFNTKTGEGVYSIQFETDDEKLFLEMQEFARRCVDGKPLSMELRDTVGAMCSDDYKARFMAEYYQLTEQQNIMDRYLRILEVRAQIEGIEL